jgi:histidinol dehydrogenase
MARRLDARAPDFAAAYAELIRSRGETVDAAETAARAVINDVRRDGLDAVLRLTKRFDGLDVTAAELAVTPHEIDAATNACSKELLLALETAAQRIADFHARQRPADAEWTDAASLTTGWRWSPVDAAGLYAPGGLAAYPSAVLMNAIPAKAAGVSRLAMATPPGRVQENPAILAAAKIAGVDEIWKIGGAQAIAALAYGAGPIAPTDVIVGPGNAFVAAAKKIVFGVVGIDSIAGPSEVFVLAEGDVDPAWIAADLLAQAEHDADAQSVLFTLDADFADAVARAVEADLSAGRAGPSARVSWDAHCAIVLVAELMDAAPLVDLAAPEHVQIVSPRARAIMGAIRHAGAFFLGAEAPEALGDYVAGPNHVLPTGRRARFASGLSTLTFMKRSTIISTARAGLEAIGPSAATIADAEGLPAHARSIRVRMGGR